MSDLKATDLSALRYLMTDDIYVVREDPLPEITNEKEEQHITFEYLGENNKFLLLLINDQTHSNLQSQELEALQKILSAKRMSLKDIAIVNQRKYPNSGWKELKNYFACSSIVLFGIEPTAIQIRKLPLNAITEFEGMQILATYSFTDMMVNEDKKREFWNQMKKL
ncbi:hypothetical protein [Arcticibacter eurypsychrophilus]|uniref:hypothetical protein n=1 Tax=Arcticibacter eurypsychrophilus TaxID=1434752 RepID=UPI00084D614F|nr:hypothetical protein [Arcticibacter eurypsychrophilus]